MCKFSFENGKITQKSLGFLFKIDCSRGCLRPLGPLLLHVSFITFAITTKFAISFIDIFRWRKPTKETNQTTKLVLYNGMIYHILYFASFEIHKNFISRNVQSSKQVSVLGFQIIRSEVGFPRDLQSRFQNVKDLLERIYTLLEN